MSRGCLATQHTWAQYRSQLKVAAPFGEFCLYFAQSSRAESILQVVLKF